MDEITEKEIGMVNTQLENIIIALDSLSEVEKTDEYYLATWDFARTKLKECETSLGVLKDPAKEESDEEFAAQFKSAEDKVERVRDLIDKYEI